MGDADNPPALDELDELDGYWTENTTITVSRYTKAQLDEHRDGRKWDEFLEKLRRSYADPITFNDAEQIAEFIDEEMGSELKSIERVESSVATIEERTGRLESMLEQLGAQR